MRYEDWEDFWAAHAPVGEFLPDGFGLHDTVGNVWEWCRDRFGGYENEGAPGTGLRNVTGVGFRVHRGGGFHATAFLVRSANRASLPPDTHRFDLGVRPARVITE